MAKAEHIERAYEAIGALMASGVTKPSVCQVANASGLARQTFYQQDDEWREVRAIINGRPSGRIKLMPVDLKQKSETARKFEALFDRVDMMQQDVKRIEDLAGKVYLELIDEVQRWFSVAAESPKKKIQIAQYLEELNSKSRLLERVLAENRLLKAEINGPGSLRVLSQKNTLHLRALAKPGILCSEFLSQYRALLPTSREAESLFAVYVLCGLPSSGKTTWIAKHQPLSPGIHIYVDSCAHQTDIRTFLVDQVRASSTAQIHCVWMRAGVEVCSERISTTQIGAENALKQEELRAVAYEFEAPSLNETFNSLIMVRGEL